MAYLRVTFDHQEIERRDLAGPMVIGRAMDCDLAVRDVLLSRRHCRIEAAGPGEWQAVDLASKNGTLLNGRPLAESQVLRDGDVLALGRLKAVFSARSLAEAGISPLRYPPPRPADPTESMCGTFVGFTYLEPGQTSTGAGIPSPRPEPKRPAAYEREDVYSLLNAIASNSWDSIYAEARRPLLPQTEFSAQDIQSPRRGPRPRSPLDISVNQTANDLPSRRPSTPRRPRAAAFAWAAVICLLALKICFDGRVRLTAVPAVSAQVPAASVAPAGVRVVVGQAVTAVLPLLL